MGEGGAGADAGDRLGDDRASSPTDKPKSYEPRRYWEALVSEQYDLTGVSHPELPRQFAEALYRQMDRAVRRARLRPTTVLDIGSGTGHWLAFWRGVGAQVSGLELTSHGTEALRRDFPEVVIYQADISEQVPVEATFEVVSAMNVLLHIVDDDHFCSAIKNIARLLAPAGVLVAMEPAVVHRWWGPSFDAAANSKARPVTEWRRVLEESGLELAEQHTVTALLANPVDTRSRLAFRGLELYWRLLGMTLRRAGRLTGPLSRALEALDRVLVRLGWAPSAKVLIIRRRSP